MERTRDERERERERLGLELTILIVLFVDGFVCVCVFVCEQGTSADQDTRFSNKMKKLLKSQKFAPELDVLVRFVCPW